MSHSLNEQSLITSAQDGDRAALGALIEAHLDFACSVAMNYLHNVTETEDAVQDSFVKAWKALARFDASKPFRPWLATIIKNTCLDRLKTKQPLALPEAILDEGDGADVRTDLVLESERLTGALLLLPAVDQTILKHHFHDGQTFNEIAKTLQQPLNTVKSRCRRALTALKKHLS